MTAAQRTAERRRMQQLIEQLCTECGDKYTWAVRWDERERLEAGFVFEASRMWIDGEATDEMLDGTCAIEARWLDRICHTIYTGCAYIVCGIEAGYGQDAGEVILRECEIMAVP